MISARFQIGGFMVLEILKRANTWLFAGLIVLTPYLGAAESEEPNLEIKEEEVIDSNVAKKDLWDLRRQVIQAFTSLTVDFHDRTMDLLWSIPSTYPFEIIETDINQIALLFNHIDPALYVQIEDLLLAYVDAGFDYAGSGSPCFVPASTHELASVWLETAHTLAQFFVSLGRISDGEAEHFFELFRTWTLFNIQFIDNARPQCALPTSPVNASLADSAYAQSRFYSYRLALEIFERILELSFNR
jgi:hypothetical protein